MGKFCVGLPPPLEFGRAKAVRNLARFRTTSHFDREYLLIDGDIDKRKTALSTKIPPTFGEQNLVNFGPLTTELTRLIFTHPNSTSLKGDISAPRGAALSNFASAREWQRLANPHC